MDIGYADSMSYMDIWISCGLDVQWSALLVAMCALFLGGQFVYCTPSRLEVDVLKCAIIP